MDNAVNSVLPDGPRLAGRKVIITGAASGMGRAIAELFAAQGSALALFDVQADALAEVAAATGGTAFQVDVSSEQAVGEAVAHAHQTMGGVDGLVNAAGILVTKPFKDTTPADWRRIHDVNLFGPYLVCRAALPLLMEAEGEGTIVNIASMGGIVPPVHMVAYAASKAGLIVLSKGIALEAAPKVRVNAICPGVIETPMTDALAMNGTVLGDAAIRAMIGLRRKGTAMEIAYLSLFLTSRESSFITGSTYEINGGAPNPYAEV